MLCHYAKFEIMVGNKLTDRNLYQIFQQLLYHNIKVLAFQVSNIKVIISNGQLKFIMDQILRGCVDDFVLGPAIQIEIYILKLLYLLKLLYQLRDICNFVIFRSAFVANIPISQKHRNCVKWYPGVLLSIHK